MKLYNVPRNSQIRYVHENQEYLLDFKHIDGMYSLCYLDDKPMHLPAWTEVEVVGDDVWNGPKRRPEGWGGW